MPSNVTISESAQASMETSSASNLLRVNTFMNDLRECEPNSQDTSPSPFLYGNDSAHETELAIRICTWRLPSRHYSLGHSSATTYELGRANQCPSGTARCQTPRECKVKGSYDAGGNDPRMMGGALAIMVTCVVMMMNG